MQHTHSPHAYRAEANTPPRQRVHAFHSRIHSIQARHIVFLLLHLMRFVHPLPSIPPSVFCSALHFPYLFPHPSTSRFHAPTGRLLTCPLLDPALAALMSRTHPAESRFASLRSPSFDPLTHSSSYNLHACCYCPAVCAARIYSISPRGLTGRGIRCRIPYLWSSSAPAAPLPFFWLNHMTALHHSPDSTTQQSRAAPLLVRDHYHFAKIAKDVSRHAGW